MGETGVMVLSDDAQRLWEVAEALNRAAAAVSPGAEALPPLMVFTDPQRTPEPWAAAGWLPAGSALVYRAFGEPEAKVVAARLRAITAERGVRLLIGMDPDLAERVGADGVHLPERLLTAAPRLRERNPGWLITGAAHSKAAIERAEQAGGLDALVLSPVFPAGGASAERLALGLKGFDALAGITPLPTYALGGITAGTAQGLLSTRACGLCGVGLASAFAV